MERRICLWEYVTRIWGATKRRWIILISSLKLDKNLQVDAHYEAGLIYTKLGENKKAIKEYQQAIAVSPKAPMPQLKLGLLYAKMKKF